MAGQSGSAVTWSSSWRGEAKDASWVRLWLTRKRRDSTGVEEGEASEGSRGEDGGGRVGSGSGWNGRVVMLAAVGPMGSL